MKEVVWHFIRICVYAGLFLINMHNYVSIGWILPAWLMWPTQAVLLAAYLKAFIRVCQVIESGTTVDHTNGERP